jgi:hypothetical protein
MNVMRKRIVSTAAAVTLALGASLAVASPAHAINRSSCSDTALTLFQQGGGLFCFENPGGMGVLIANVRGVWAGGRDGFVWTNKGGFPFLKDTYLDFAQAYPDLVTVTSVHIN